MFCVLQQQKLGRRLGISKMYLSTSVAEPGIHSKAMVLLIYLVRAASIVQQLVFYLSFVVLLYNAVFGLVVILCM